MKNEKRVNEDDMQDGLCKSTMCAAAIGNQDKILKENNLSLELPRHITNSMAGQFPAGGGGGMMGGQFAGRSGAGILHPADILSGGMNSSQLSLMLNHFSGTSGGKSDTMSTLNNIMSSSAMGATGPPPSVDALLMLASRSTSIGSNSGVNLGGDSISSTRFAGDKSASHSTVATSAKPTSLCCHGGYADCDYDGHDSGIWRWQCYWKSVG